MVQRLSKPPDQLAGCAATNLSEVDLGLLAGSNADCRYVRLCDIHPLEGNLLPHSVHHQLTIERETWREIVRCFWRTKRQNHGTSPWCFTSGIRHGINWIAVEAILYRSSPPVEKWRIQPGNGVDWSKVLQYDVEILTGWRCNGGTALTDRPVGGVEHTTDHIRLLPDLPVTFRSLVPFAALKMCACALLLDISRILSLSINIDLIKYLTLYWVGQCFYIEYVKLEARCLLF